VRSRGKVIRPDRVNNYHPKKKPMTDETEPAPKRAKQQPKAKAKARRNYAAELQNLRGRVGLALRMLRHGNAPDEPEVPGLLKRVVNIVIETLEGGSDAPV